jgi:hypothetical protein
LVEDVFWKGEGLKGFIEGVVELGGYSGQVSAARSL